MAVEVKGLIELKKALKDYTPDLANQLDVEIEMALGGIIKKARSYVPSTSPLSNFGYRKRSEKHGSGLRKFPLFNSARIQKKIEYSSVPRKTNRRGFKAVYFIINKDPAGAIFETAGRKIQAVNLGLVEKVTQTITKLTTQIIRKPVKSLFKLSVNSLKAMLRVLLKRVGI